jgi:hypothetical protein
MTIFCITFTINNYTDEIILKAQGALGQAGIKYIVWGYEVGKC